MCVCVFFFFWGGGELGFRNWGGGGSGVEGVLGLGVFGFGLSKGSYMVPECGPLPPLKGSDAWAPGLYRVCKGHPF